MAWLEYHYLPMTDSYYQILNLLFQSCLLELVLLAHLDMLFTEV